MLRTISPEILHRFFILTLLTAVSLSAAQQVPAAPVPLQIIAAKKVFISNAGGEEPDPRSFFLPTMGSNQPYDKFYAALKSAGRFEPVLAPSDADLILEIRFTFLDIPRVADISDNVGDPRLRLSILDPKTHVLLWAFSERVATSAGPHWKEKRERNFDQAITVLLDDITKLSMQPRP